MSGARQHTPAPDCASEALRPVADDVRDFLNDVMEFTHEADVEAVALWCLTAHMHQDFDTFGHLLITSDEVGSGKSWLMALIMWLTGGRGYSHTTPAALQQAGHRGIVGLDDFGRLLAGRDRKTLIETLAGMRLPLVITGLGSQALPAELSGRVIRIELRAAGRERARGIRQMRQSAQGRAEALHARMITAVAEASETLRHAAQLDFSTPLDGE
jgi:hypothetical protein